MSTSCSRCSLCETANTIKVMGPKPEGNPDVMVVLEMPTINEDLYGGFKPTNAKKFLNETLLKHGISSYYSTYAVKCRTPELRAPNKEEIKACRAYLSKEVEVYKPKAILAMGNTSLIALTGKSGIANYRGKELSFEGIPVIASYSPTAVLKNPKYSNQFNADVYKLSRLLLEETSNDYECIIHYVMTKEDLQGLVKALKRASENENAFGGNDLETATFEYWRPETSVMTMGLCIDDHESWAIPLVHPQSPWRNQTGILMKALKPYLEKIKWAGNNWKYDMKWFRGKYGITPNFGPDNMLISYALDENSPHGLKYQAALYCEADDYDREIFWPSKYDPCVDDITEKVKEYHQMNLTKMLKYNALDAFYSRHVYKHLRERIGKDQRVARVYKHLLEKGSMVFTYIEEIGMWIDPERLEEARRLCEESVVKSVEILRSHLPENWEATHLSKKQLKEGFNWNSTKQLGELFFTPEGFNFPILQHTPSGKPSTAESTLIELNSEFDHPALNELMTYRKWTKYMNTYINPWSHKLDHNSRLHPSFKLHGTVTGRLSGEDGVHQVPRDKFIRGIIGAPPGWTFFEIDGSQIELRVVAAIANERTMLRIFATGGDIHTETASTVTGVAIKDVSGDDRKKAKAVNFGFVYGMGWRKFKQYAWEKYGVRLSDKQAKDYRKRFFEKYPDLIAWHARMRKLVRASGYVVSPIGRKRRLPDIYSSEENMQAAAEREAINSPVQGFGSDYVLAGFIEMVLEIILKEDPNFETIRPVGAVHDAQYYEIRNDYLDYWTPIIKRVFDDPTRLLKWFGYVPPVEITGDCKMGNHWGDAKDWHIGEPYPHKLR